MNVDWDLNDGVMELPVLTGFSVAALPYAMLAVQLRCAPGMFLGAGVAALLRGKRDTVARWPLAARQPQLPALAVRSQRHGDIP